MGTLWQDTKYGARVLLKSPGFALVSVLTLALGVGATTAIFSVVNAVLLRPLPYPQPERIVQVWENNHRRGWLTDPVSPLNFVAWEEQAKSFESLAAYEYENFVLTGGGEPERVSGALVSRKFFDVMGVKPAAGRSFAPEEDVKGGPRVAVISRRLAERQFGAGAEAVGRTLTLNNQSYAVVGVMPAGFQFPSRSTDLWATPAVDRSRPRSDHFLYSVGRLRPGVALDEAQAEMDGIAARLAEQFPDTNRDFGVTLVSLHEQVTGKSRRALLVMLGAVGLMLLIACANVANLLLARATARRREIAVRAALGAGRWRIARQLLTESLLLAVLGGGSGLLLAAWGVDLLGSAAARSLPRAAEIGIDTRAFAFALGASVFTGLLFGLAPAVSFSSPDLNQSLKEGGGGALKGSRRSRLQGALVVAEIALALVLLVGAGLLVKSYARLQAVDPGFRADGVLTFQIALPETKYETEESQAEFYARALEKIRAVPGVEGAGLVSDLPFSGSRTSRSFEIEGRARAEGADSLNADYRKASPGYFGALGIALLRGRQFSERDGGGAPPVAVVNEALARKFFPGEEVLGKRVVFREGDRDVAREMVGVVADLKHDDLTGRRAPEIYVPVAQHANPWMFAAARGTVEPRSLAGALRAAVREVDADQPIHNVTTMRQRLEDSVAPQRFNAALLAFFASVALALACVGVFGVMSYTVAQRTHEIGIRMALGALPRDITRLVVGQGLRLALAGALVGVAAAMALTRLMAGLLFEVRPADPTVFAGLALLLAGAALLACYLPSRRAAKVDPLVALRDE